jgi:hypothetical protein
MMISSGNKFQFALLLALVTIGILTSTASAAANHSNRLVPQMSVAGPVICSEDQPFGVDQTLGDRILGTNVHYKVNADTKVIEGLVVCPTKPYKFYFD